MKITIIKENITIDDMCRLEDTYKQALCCDTYYEMDLLIGARKDIEKEVKVDLKEYSDECDMIMFGLYENKIFVVDITTLFKDISEKIDAMK